MFSMTIMVLDPSIIFSLIVGGALACLLLTQLARKVFDIYQQFLRPFFITKLTYPRYIPLLSWTYPLRVLILITYLAVTACFNLIGVESISAAATRAAKLSLINLFPLFICSHEFACYLLGLPLSTYRVIHRATGIVAFVEALVHIACHGVIYVTQSTSPSLHQISTVYAVAAIALFAAIPVFSVFKTHLYELYVKMHTACALALLFVTWKHISDKKSLTAWYLYSSIFLYVGSAIFRLLRTLYRNVSFVQRGLCVFQHRGTSVIVRIRPARPWQIQAGQRINLCVPGAGVFAFSQMHPFVIAWWEMDDQGTQSISLLVRPRTGLTRLFGGSLVEPEVYSVLIDGPYGPDRAGGMVRSLSEYGHIFMIATGIGIAAQIPYIKELLDGQRKGVVKTQKITLIWELDLAQDYDGAQDWLQLLITQDTGYKFQVLIFDTSRSSSKDDPELYGDHELIKVWGGDADWEEKLLEEMTGQVGTMLITVSAKRSVREKLRALAIKYEKRHLELFELEFQPWGRKRSIWSYF